MGELLKLAASPEVLNHAWRHLQNSKGTWRYEISMGAMRRDIVLHLGQLSKELGDGSYQPDPMRCYHILKGNNNKRLICSSTVRDRVAQRAILTVLEPLGENIFLDSSFGYRPHCTVDMALSQAREKIRRGYAWLVDADITQCFDSIPQRPVLKKLQSLCGDRDLVRLVKRFLCSMPRNMKSLWSRSTGLPQGLVLSPFLCNLYLHDLDYYMTRKGVPMVRFADDFILFCRSERDAQHALKLATRKLRRLDLLVNEEKTRIHRSAPRHRFLGKRLPDSRPRFIP